MNSLFLSRRDVSATRRFAGPKRRWRARTPKRFAPKEAAERPTGFGVRARQRRFSPTPTVSNGTTADFGSPAATEAQANRPEGRSAAFAEKKQSVNSLE